MYEDNKALVRGFFEKLSVGDREGAWALFTDDAVWYSPTTHADVPVGEMAGNMGWLLDNMPEGISFELGTTTAEEDRVAIMLSSRGMLSQGREYRNFYHMLFQIRDHRICHVWEFNDTAHILDVIPGLPGYDVLRAQLDTQ
jgi:ketosteroid isomerase-like protein